MTQNPTPNDVQLLATNDSGSFIFDSSHCCHLGTHDTCAVLNCLGLIWSTDLESIVQPSMKRVVIYTDLKSLIDINKSIANENKAAALDHLRTTYKLRSTEHQRELWERLHQEKIVENPIDGLEAPMKRYRCSACKKWFQDVSRHKHKMKANADHVGHVLDFIERFTIQLYRSSSLVSLCIPLDVTWKPGPEQELANNASPPFHRQLPVALNQIPLHIMHLHWPNYLCTLDVDSYQALLSLIQPPSLLSAKLFQPKSLQWKVERTLAVIKKVAKFYILDADRQLRNSHSVVKNAITHGYVT